METPEFKFEMTAQAAQQNWQVLKKYKLNLYEVLKANNEFQLQPGSECRPASTLNLIFDHQPLWPRLSSQLWHGAEFPLEKLDPESKKKDLQDALAFGNQ